MTNIFKFAVAFILATLVGCNTIYEDISPCRVSFDFVYDKNMLYANAFHSQCDNVELFIFNKDSIFIKSIKDKGEALKKSDYKMDVALENGHYTAFAWVGKGDSYETNNLIAGVSKINDLLLNLKADAYVSFPFLGQYLIRLLS